MPDETPDLPCPASQPIALLIDGQMPPTEASLPCALPRGHEGHHECQTPGGPYAFR